MLLDRSQLLHVVDIDRADRRPIVVVNGCFDCLHPGHLWLLTRARESVSAAASLFVLVNSDASVRERKGPGRPIMAEWDRASTVGALKGVRAAAIFNSESDLETLLAYIRPDVLVKGSDWLGKPITGADYCGKVQYVGLLPGHSTSAIVERIRASFP